MDHHYENLGPERFQQLCQALVAQEFSGTVCFPVGQPDGGRDAAKYDLSQYPQQLVTAFQVKFSRHLLHGEDARNWLFNALLSEETKVAELKERGLKQYVVITNVAGTSHLDTGSIDKLREQLSEKLRIPICCWWRDDLNRRLDGNWDIKFRYPEILSGPDFLRLLDLP
jgi:hypothetical protein